MKHTALLPLLCALALSLTACGNQTTTASITDTATQIPTVEDVLDEATASSEANTDTVAQTADVPEGFGSYDGVDVDLTVLNSVMVYSQVYDMLINAQDYVGQTVKMHGTFGYYYVESLDLYRFGVLVQDATACCAQGIEFVLLDDADYTFPQDYPDPGEAITVVGVFQFYNPEEAPDVEYFHIEEAEFITA